MSAFNVLWVFFVFYKTLIHPHNMFCDRESDSKSKFWSVIGPVHVTESVCRSALQTFGEKLLGMFSVIMPISVALSTFGGINGYLFTSSRWDSPPRRLFHCCSISADELSDDSACRLCFSGAREGHLPSLLAMIHYKNCTPIPALLVCVRTAWCYTDLWICLSAAAFKLVVIPHIYLFCV